MSGNTLESLSNLNVQKIKKDCLFITEKRELSEVASSQIKK